ncbi:gamma-glutamylcyclotransferase family protein [Sneathiella chinensis]|uniref:Gamma-glutamylcyclotransferase n=1 Tax=Sneathiella chinensis TaxID=349750 RepID=A0ABQ5U5J2_9PROT|nr:gamma-glutamylcyclotransferase family protein [Sneathiella chinensis]GLQ06988.1 gamma-glutamylcyclotransferase [Sneathiella chinensis]
MAGGGPFLFVYGTLRLASEVPAARLLKRLADYQGQALIQGRLYDLGRYPGVICTPDPAEQVVGDLFQLREPETVLQALDIYEECSDTDPKPHLYVRREVRALPRSGGELTAWTYLFNRDVTPYRAIPSGDYLSFLKT